MRENMTESEILIAKIKDDSYRQGLSDGLENVSLRIDNYAFIVAMAAFLGFGLGLGVGIAINLAGELL